MIEQNPSPKPHRGRPRKSGQTSTNQRSDILNTAIRLFTEHGFQRTSMTQIARESGLNQSSLYYWYRNKAAILQDILAQNHLSENVMNALRDIDAPSTVKLYAVMASDLEMLCALPFDYYDLEHSALAHADEFEDFYENYDHLRQGVRTIIEEGMADGSFSVSDASNAAIAVLTLNEGLQHRFRIQRADPAQADKEFDLNRYIRLGAEGSLRMVHGDEDLEDIVSQAKQLMKELEASRL